MSKLVRHHIKYKEIHGVDEVVLMDHGEHQKLHARLRKTGKCNIPADELYKISHAASQRDILNCGGVNRERMPSIEQIINIFDEYDLVSSRQVADLIGYSRPVVDVMLKNMCENEDIKRKNVGTEKKPVFIYWRGD